MLAIQRSYVVRLQGYMRSWSTVLFMITLELLVEGYWILDVELIHVRISGGCDL